LLNGGTPAGTRLTGYRRARRLQFEMMRIISSWASAAPSIHCCFIALTCSFLTIRRRVRVLLKRPDPGAIGAERLPVDELIAKANIAYLRQLLNEAKLAGLERERALQRLAREEARLFARSLQDVRAVGT
jgi:hypothetical protein